MRCGSAVGLWIPAVLLCSVAPAAPDATSPPPPPFRKIADVRRLPPDQAALGLRVNLEAVVTYYHHEWNTLFVQDAEDAIFVHVYADRPRFPIRAGQRVEIVGKTSRGDFEPTIAEPQIRVLSEPGLPAAQVVTLKELGTARYDAFLVEAAGIVHSAAVVDGLLNLTVKMEGGKLKVHVKDWHGLRNFGLLVDAAVRVRGVCTTLTNEHRQFLGAVLWSTSAADVVVESKAPSDPFAAAARPMGDLRRLAFGGGLERRLKVAGTVTLALPGRGVFLQDDTDGVFVQTAQTIRLQPGDRVEAVGFLAPGGYRPILESGAVRRVGGGPPPPPVPISIEQALSGSHESRLVEIQGRVVGRIVSGGEPALVLQSGDVMFNVRMQQQPTLETLAALQAGSLVKVVGVCSLPAAEAGAPRGFQVSSRTAADLTVLQNPPWWTAGRVRWLLFAVFGVFLAALGWATGLRRRLHKQTAVIRTRLESEAALEQRYRDLVENATDLVFALDPDGRFTSINAAAERILGYTREEILGKPLAEISAGDGDGLARPVAAAGPTGNLAHRYELEVVAKDRRRVVLEVSARALMEGGQPRGLEGIARDVTGRKQIEEELRRKEEALRESQQRFALAVRGTNDGVWDWDLRADTVYYSPRWKSMLGYLEEEIGDSLGEWLRLVHSEDLERLTEKLQQHREGAIPHLESEHRMLHRDGTYRWVLSRGFALRDEEGTAYRMAGAQTDVTDRRAYDALTGLPNKALFVERLEKAVSRARAGGQLFAVLFLDLDRFKVVNDSLGHLAGDRLLVSFAERLESCIRPGDMLARFGGDEFAILVDGIDAAGDAARVAERIQKALATSFDLSGPEVYTSASVGIALSTSGYDRAEDILRDADTAMYRAKSGGRARYEVFDAAMREQVTVFMRTQNDLRRALEREELRVHYQPIVQLATGAIVSFEALVRWQHPERGLLGPEDFVAVAEETGLIVSIGDWVVRRACRQLRAWRDRFPAATDLSVCVNLSARQVTDPDLVSRIREALLDADLDPQRLILEITESAIMETADTAVAKIAALKAIGIALHLDDFGTGYSSLSYLHRFPIEALKIDRSFVATMMDNEDARAIVKSILSLAESLRLTVVAEGVETEEQAALLRTLQCSLAQGYYFSRPLEPALAADLLAVADRDGLVPDRRSGVT